MRHQLTGTVLCFATLGVLLPAETLRLRSGEVIVGVMEHADSREIQFRSATGARRLAISDVEAIDFEVSANSPAAGVAGGAPAPIAVGAAVIPAGSSIVVRMIDAIDSASAQAGQASGRAWKKHLR